MVFSYLSKFLPMHITVLTQRSNIIPNTNGRRLDLGPLEKSVLSPGVALVVLGHTVNPKVLSSTLAPRLPALDDFHAIVRGRRD